MMEKRIWSKLIPCSTKAQTMMETPFSDFKSSDSVTRNLTLLGYRTEKNNLVFVQVIMIN